MYKDSASSHLFKPLSCESMVPLENRDVQLPFFVRPQMLSAHKRLTLLLQTRTPLH